MPPPPPQRRSGTWQRASTRLIELVGTSDTSFEKAATAAVERAGKSLRDMRVAEITQFDMQIEKGKVKAYRAKVKVSFKFEKE